MGKSSRNKKLKKQENEALKRYGNLKLSEVLLTLCEPYIIPEMNQKRYKSLISLSVIAWNVATFPEDIRTETLIEAIQFVPELKGLNENQLILLMKSSTPDDTRNHVVMLHMILGMIQQKINRYPNDNRFIVEFWFESENGRNHLQVKSITPDAEKNTHSVEA